MSEDSSSQGTSEQVRNLQQTLERRRDDFRLYLENNGIFDRLSKALLQIFEEPNFPDDPVKYFQNLIMGADFDAGIEELDRLGRETRELQADIVGLTEENKKLRATLGISPDVSPAPPPKPTLSEHDNTRRTSSAMKEKPSTVAKDTASKEALAMKDRDKKKKPV